MSNQNGVKVGIARMGPEHSAALKAARLSLMKLCEAGEGQGNFRVAMEAKKAMVTLDDLAMIIAETLRDHLEDQAREHLLLQVGEHALIKPDVRDAIDRFTKDGIQPTGFLRAVLSNDLADAVVRADTHNLRTLAQIMDYVKATVPAEAWGSGDAVVGWPAKARLATEMVDVSVTPEADSGG